MKFENIASLLLLIGAAVGGAVGAVVYAHSTFATLREIDSVDRRLFSIETKIDQIHRYHGIPKED